MKENEVSFRDAAGSQQVLPISVELYKAAGDAKVGLAQYLNTRYPTSSEKASTFDQMAASAGLFVKSDKALGVNSPMMSDVMNGTAQIGASAITRDGGGSIGTPASRILYPEVVMQVIESQLTSSDDPFLAGIEKMIAITTNVTTPRVEQPIINTTAPAGAASQAIAQLAAPANMLSITVADQSYRIPTMSIGLEISDEAQQSATLDLVSVALAANAREQAVLRGEADLVSMIAGDSDLGESAVSGVNASTFDSAINGSTKMTQRGWFKFLRNNYRKMNKDWLIMDEDTAIEIEARTGKPVVTGDDPTSPRLDALFTVENLSLPTPRVLLVDTAVVGADTIVALDSRYAIRKVVNVSATYSAIEEYVLRRGSALRIDYGYVMKKLYSDAWTSLTIGA